MAELTVCDKHGESAVIVIYTGDKCPICGPICELLEELVWRLDERGVPANDYLPDRMDLIVDVAIEEERERLVDEGMSAVCDKHGDLLEIEPKVDGNEIKVVVTACPRCAAGEA
jgi:hypothetical protein